jgi:hypothetical protein
MSKSTREEVYFIPHVITIKTLVLWEEVQFSKKSRMQQSESNKKTKSN